MATLADWLARITATGVTYEPRDSRTRGAIHVTERLRPPRPPAQIVRAEVKRLVDNQIIRDERIGPIEKLRTTDGEHAALITVRGTGVVDECPLFYLFGFVFAEDFYNYIEGWITDELGFVELDQLVREAISTSHLCLGSGRPRMFLYDPPPGWQALGRGPLLTEWYPLDFPKHHARLSIPAAFSKKEGPALVETLMSRWLTAFKRADKFQLDKIDVGGLKAIIELRIGSFPYNPGVYRFTHIFHVSASDQQYNYLFRLDTTHEHLEEDRQVLHAVLKTVHGVPGPSDAAQTMSWVID